MLERTFLHVQGVGVATERRLWEAGVRTWDDFALPRPIALSPSRASLIQAEIKRSRAALAEGDAAYFAAVLPSREHWRLYPRFRERAVCLDIETAGLGEAAFQITAITLYDGRAIRVYVSGENLDDFVADIAAYEVLVTYNGRGFDVPCLERRFGIELPRAHIDLRPVLHGLGVRGGLKACERAMGLSRPDLDGVDGFDAVLLWREYQATGNPAARETLLAYNVADTVNLEWLLVAACNKAIARTPFAGTDGLDLPERPVIPFLPDLDLVRRLREGHSRAQHRVW